MIKERASGEPANKDLRCRRAVGRRCGGGGVEEGKKGYRSLARQGGSPPPKGREVGGTAPGMEAHVRVLTKF